MGSLRAPRGRQAHRCTCLHIPSQLVLTEDSSGPCFQMRTLGLSLSQQMEGQGAGAQCQETGWPQVQQAGVWVCGHYPTL